MGIKQCEYRPFTLGPLLDASPGRSLRCYSVCRPPSGQQESKAAASGDEGVDMAIKGALQGPERSIGASTYTLCTSLVAVVSTRCAQQCSCLPGSCSAANRGAGGGVRSRSDSGRAGVSVQLFQLSGKQCHRSAARFAAAVALSTLCIGHGLHHRFYHVLQRMLAHKVAQHYKLQTSTVGYEAGQGRVVAKRTAWAAAPAVSAMQQADRHMLTLMAAVDGCVLDLCRDGCRAPGRALYVCDD